MIIQYSGGTIRHECFNVLDGMLVQTPFRLACMDWCDWLILVFTGMSLLFASLPGLLAVILLPIAILSDP
jgi:hypothetical protein